METQKNQGKSDSRKDDASKGNSNTKPVDTTKKAEAGKNAMDPNKGSAGRTDKNKR